MRALMAEELITELVAGGDYHIVVAGDAVCDHLGRRAPKVRDQQVANPGFYQKSRDPAWGGDSHSGMLVSGVKGEEIGRLTSPRLATGSRSLLAT
jgi:hypothetical protein